MIYWEDAVSAAEYRTEGMAAYGVVKLVILLPALPVPASMNICIGDVEGSGI